MSYEKLLDFDFANSSQEERQRWWEQDVYPLLATLIALDSKLRRPPEMRCEDCPHKKACDDSNASTEDKTCFRCESHLPHRYTGSGAHEQHLGPMTDHLADNTADSSTSNHRLAHSSARDQREIRHIRRIRSDEVLAVYRSYMPLFTAEQWEVICLKFEHDMTFDQIGKALGITPSAASDRFRRAQKRLKKHIAEKAKNATRENTSKHVDGL